MKLSLNWLKRYIDLPESPSEIAHILTMSGLEVEGMEVYSSVPGGLEGVVVGKVLSAEQHPNADRLRVCQVDVGQEQPLPIVCGAPNVAAGQTVAVALVGTTLYPTQGEPITLKKTKIRGIESQGMICAADELGIGDDHSGILVLADSFIAGSSAANALGVVNDTVLEIGLTPNRCDAASHFGVARDLAAILNRQLCKPRASLPLTESSPVSVQITAPERCPRYASAVIRNIKVKESPHWLQQFLLAIGERPINCIVDITNFVLFEFGTPLHAFDLAKIRQQTIIVREATSSEEFITLDQKQRTILPGDLLICDAERPLVIAGIMGGLDSGVTEETTDIFLESAYFTPAGIHQTARRLGIHSASAFRFERGIDPHAAWESLARAVELILEISGGTIEGT
ncbi:MAG: phenylalanine--tRNA ligase subunit beta, partial [Bacteroidia bacterium]|nr:phenylalanine--tRNA ligase subunit beta [Bacteroidia bacterium]